jgi:hypothetical protein
MKSEWVFFLPARDKNLSGKGHRLAAWKILFSSEFVEIGGDSWTRVFSFMRKKHE